MIVVSSGIDLSENIGGSGSFRSSHLFQAPRKIIFTFHFLHKSFTLDGVKLAELSDNRFELKKCHFRGSKHTLTRLHIFRGSKLVLNHRHSVFRLIYPVHSLYRYSVSDNVFYCEYIMACYITKNLRLSTLVNCLLVLFFFNFPNLWNYLVIIRFIMLSLLSLPIFSTKYAGDYFSLRLQHLDEMAFHFCRHGLRVWLKWFVADIDVDR